VGVVAGTHGTDGRLRVAPDTDNPRRFARGSRLLIAGAPYTVDRVTTSADGLLLIKLREIRNREDAALMKGEPVLVRASDLPALPEDTYYHYQLIDMTVVDTAGAELGRLTEVISTGANDVYVVTGDGSELLVPALAGVVVAVDVAERRMTIAVPEGIEPRSTMPKPPKTRPPRRRRPLRKPQQ
jgi:16S rRNA processing protein RimM